MADPIFWLGLSLLLVAVSLTAVLMAALPAFLELARAARSAEKLFDTLSRELPPTLEAIRLTGIEITNLSDDVSQNVQSAGRIVDQIDQSISGVKQQARQAQVTTRSLVAGFRAAWQTFNRSASLQDVNQDINQDVNQDTNQDSEVAVPQLNRAATPLNLPQPNRDVVLENRLPDPELLTESSTQSRGVASETASETNFKPEFERKQTLGQPRSRE